MLNTRIYKYAHILTDIFRLLVISGLKQCFYLCESPVAHFWISHTDCLKLEHFITFLYLYFKAD